jgi:hypothetical protein
VAQGTPGDTGGHATQTRPAATAPWGRKAAGLHRAADGCRGGKGAVAGVGGFAALGAAIALAVPLAMAGTAGQRVQSESTAAAQQVCDTTAHPLSSPSARFEDHGDGTVTDRVAGLTWMRCSAGQAWLASRAEAAGAAGVHGTCSGTPQPLDWAAAQSLAQRVNRSGDYFFNDWRIPQLRELATLAERQCVNPRINLVIFPNTPADRFWTVTPRPGEGSASEVYALDFGPAGIDLQPKAAVHLLRLVRHAR